MTEIATVPKAHSFQTGQRYQSLMFENLNENCVNISRPYILYFPRNKPLKTVTVEPGRFIVLNDSFRPKMVKQIYLNFSIFFKF